MRIFRPIALTLLSGCLAGCGEGGGINSTPTPPAPFPLTATASFQTITGTLAYTGTVYNFASLSGGNATPSQDTTAGRGSAVGFGYDATTGTYSLTGGGASASFTAANATTATGYGAAFAKTSGTVTDTLALYGNAPASAPSAPAPVQLTYTSFGFWSHADTSTVQTQNTYFVYGQPTGSTAMPTTGTATYQTTLAASMLQYAHAASQFAQLSGTASISANFAAGTVNTAVTLQTTGGSSMGTFSGTAAINADQFAGSLTSTNDQFTGGGFSGGFYGPAGQEMGYTFWAKLNNPDPYAGASVQPASTAISGVVVGKKN
jgi:hypothetical protein